MQEAGALLKLYCAQAPWLYDSDFEMYVFALSPKDCWGRNFSGNFCCGIYRACVGDIEFGNRRV